MRRACIYVIYDKQMKINPYIGYVLSEIDKFVSDIYVVCNFKNIAVGDEYITPYATRVFFRENIGFDSGAYQDMLNKFIGWDDILSFDQLILTNDTYFGPIYPFDDMFSVMEKEECDFWGITRHPKGFLEGYGEFEEHIQSYFFCFKHKVLHDIRFRSFWKNLRTSKNKNQAIAGFELGINKFLKKQGYAGKAYMDYTSQLSSAIDISNPYNKYGLELIRDGHIPIIKKTNFYTKNRWLMNALDALEYIKDNTDYDTSLICDYIEEYQKKGLIGTYYDFCSMESFVKNHKNIYLYGAGIWGEITFRYFARKKWNFDAFIVTEPRDEEKMGKPVIRFSEANIDDETGIIIAQEYKDVCDEILEYIGDSCRSEQIFTPCYPAER